MSQLRFGFADEIITPVLNGHCLDGYGFRLGPAEFIRDDIHAKVCAIVSGDSISLLFSMDLIGMGPRLYRLVTSQISHLTGVPRERIALCFIHTHAAPAAGILDELPIDYDYFARVGELCGQAALRAIERACPCSVSFSILPEQITQSYNRRNGRDVIDRSIRAAAFHDENGQLRGVICSASCHAVVCTKMCVSADWLSELNKLSSDALPYLYVQNRGADVDPLDMGSHTVDDLIEKLGKQLSEPVERFAKAAVPGTPLQGTLITRYENVSVPMMAMTDTDTMKATIRAEEEKYFTSPAGSLERHITFRELQFWRHMLEMAENGENFDIKVPLQLFCLNHDFVFAFVPFEMLTLTGNKLEELFVSKGFAPENIYTCGYSNSTNGYLAPIEEFEFGGYEVAGASHWYNIPQNSTGTERAVLEWFTKQADMIYN